jgi:hypothetical protein
MATKLIKNSYNWGELSEYMAGRTDLVQYHSGCSKLINATVLPHGGVVKRSGTEYIAKAPNKANLVSFEFSVTDTLILEFSNLLLRFYKDGDRVMNDSIDVDGVTLPSGTPVSISTDGAHGRSTGDVVRFSDLDGGVTALNYNGNHSTEWTITVVDADDFTLDGTDGDDYTAWGSAGSVTSIYEITSPFTSEEAFEIHVTQSADVMYIAHEDHPPQKLSRFGDTDWTIADVDFTGGPFLAENLDDADTFVFARTGGTVAADGYFPTGATGTLTATGHTPFLGTANDVGTQWQISTTRTDNVLDTADNDLNTAPTGSGIRILGDYTFSTGTYETGETVILWRKQGNGEWQEERTFLAATALSATEEEEDVFYSFTRKGDGSETTVNVLTAKNQVNNGVVVVTTHNSTTVANVTVVDAVQQDEATANSPSTSMWAEGAWGKFRGYPRTVQFFEDRLWWASSTNNPDTLWGSRSGKYENHSFTSLGLATDAIIAPLKDNESSQIQWMQARQVMAVGAANKEYRFGNPDPDKAVTPEPGGAKSTPQTSFGSDNIQPVILNDAIFFFQRQGRKLRGMKFDSISENFTADDATLLANTILESQPVRMAVQRVPDSIVWIVRTDGILLSFTYEPDEEIAGWARHITQNDVGVETPVGFFESVAIIHGSTEDEVWVAVRRVIDGSTVRYVERFGTRIFDEVDEALMLDVAKVVESAFVAQDIVLASDTVRANSGECNSSLCGGTPA